MATGTNTKTPELSYFEARGIEKPEIIRIHDATYRMGDTASRRAKTIRDFLRGGRTSTSLIKLADLRYGDTTGGTTYAWVVMEPGFPQEVEIVYEKGAQPELGMRCRMREVSYTIS